MTAAALNRAPSAQHWKAPPDYFANARRRGVPLHALPTLAKIGFHAANADNTGTEMMHATVARWGGYSVRTVQRDVAHAVRSLPDLGVKRRRRSATVSHPNHYTVPRAPREEPGTLIWGDLILGPAFREATRTQAGIYLILLEQGRQFRRNWRELAELCGCGVTAVRDAVRHFVAAGLIQLTGRTGESGSPIGNRFDMLNKAAEALAALGRAIREVGSMVPRVLSGKDRRERRRADLVEQLGPILTAWDEQYPGGRWWFEVEAAAESGNHKPGAVLLRSLIVEVRRRWKEHAKDCRRRRRPAPDIPQYVNRMTDLRAIVPELAARRAEWPQKSLDVVGDQVAAAAAPASSARTSETRQSA